MLARSFLSILSEHTLCCSYLPTMVGVMLEVFSARPTWPNSIRTVGAVVVPESLFISHLGTSFSTVSRCSSAQLLYLVHSLVAYDISQGRME